MKPINRLLLSLILAVIFCQLSFIVFTKELRKYQVHNTERLTEILEHNTNFDVLFIGSSRTHFSINPKVIDSICKINSYNAGIEGGNLYEFEMILLAYLENHPSPKYLVLTLDLNAFTPGIKMFNYPVYFPYTDNKVILKYLLDNGHFTISKKLIPFLKITDYDDDNKGYFLKGLSGASEIPNGDFQYKGFISNTSNCIRPGEPVPQKSSYEVSIEKKQCLDRIISICKLLNIKLIFTYAPEYKKMYQEQVKNSTEILAIINDYAIKNNFSFFREDQLDICSNPALFANIAHLNKDGAQQYSAILAGELNEILK